MVGMSPFFSNVSALMTIVIISGRVPSCTNLSSTTSIAVLRYALAGIAVQVVTCCVVSIASLHRGHLGVVDWFILNRRFWVGVHRNTNFALVARLPQDRVRL